MRSQHRFRTIAEHGHIDVVPLSDGCRHGVRRQQQPFGHADMPEAIAPGTPDQRTNDLVIYHRREEESLLVLRWVALAP